MPRAPCPALTPLISCHSIVMLLWALPSSWGIVLGAPLASVPQGARDKRERKPLPAPSTILNVKMESAFYLALFKSRQCLSQLCVCLCLCLRRGNQILQNSAGNFVSHKNKFFAVGLCKPVSFVFLLKMATEYWLIWGGCLENDILQIVPTCINNNIWLYVYSHATSSWVL